MRLARLSRIRRRLGRRRAVIVVQALPVPLKRRVWQEAVALRDEGWHVTVISPLNALYPQRRETVDGIAIYRHRVPFEARTPLGFLLEYSWTLIAEFALLTRVWVERGFDLIQVCNPPDVIILIAVPFRLLGKRVVLDQHDSFPALFAAKFPRAAPLTSVLALIEQVAFRLSDLVVTANESYRADAIRRGLKNERDVVTVYGYPQLSAHAPTDERRARQNHAALVVGYVGVIGDQDGVEGLVHAVAELVRVPRHQGLRAVIVGDGPALGDIKRLTARLGLEGRVSFTGYLDGRELCEALQAFDVAVVPDPVNAFNSSAAMNKVFLYAHFGLPVVASPLAETMRLLGDSAVFACGARPAELARSLDEVLADGALRAAMRQRTRALADTNFDWGVERGKYVSAVERALAR